MDGLQNGRHASHVRVDLGVGEELGGEVAVQPGLHHGAGVDPERRVEEDVVEQLPGEEREAEQLNQDGLNCSRYLPIHINSVRFC